MEIQMMVKSSTAVTKVSAVNHGICTSVLSPIIAETRGGITPT
jgi:hypothetical protein